MILGAGTTKSHSDWKNALIWHQPLLANFFGFYGNGSIQHCNVNFFCAHYK